MTTLFCNHCKAFSTKSLFFTKSHLGAEPHPDGQQSFSGRTCGRADGGEVPVVRIIAEVATPSPRQPDGPPAGEGSERPAQPLQTEVLFRTSR